MRDCDFKELFPYDMVGEVAITLSRIRHLKLEWVPYIRHVWNQESQPDQFLQNLQTLQISICDSLISLAPSSASFQNLSVVDVYLCEGMLNLISSSTALSLVNLTSMSIKECEVMTEIILANEGDESQFQSDEIIFRKLATLKLDCLKSLICFCLGTCTIKFPSLEEVYVSQCPRLKIFSQGVLSAPKLKRVYVTEEGDKWRWIGDLNTTIKQMYIEMVGFNAIQHLKLSEFPQLKEVWHDQLPFQFFYNLSTLVIDECGSFPISVPSSLLPVLNNLEELEVSNCDSVEQAFGLEWPNGNEHLGLLSNLNNLRLIDLPRLRCVWNEVPNGILNFRNLKMLKFHGCRSLRYIFTPTMSLYLVQLKEVEVKSCFMVEEIITKGVANEAVDNIIFPELNSISLESLPSLISFNSGNKTAECPSLRQITVADCPSKFCSTFLRELGANVADGISELKIQFPNLVDLKLSLNNLEKIWDDQLIELYPFEMLTTLMIDGCGNLTTVFTSSMVGSLAQLKYLEICNCNCLEEVIITQAEFEEIILPKLESLRMRVLPNLIRFCSGNLIECQSLKWLWIENCPRLQAFVSSSSTVHQGNSTLFDEKVSFPNLEEIYAFYMHKLKMIWNNEVREDSFCKLKFVRVEHCKQLLKVFPSKLLIRFQSVETLILHGCDLLEEVFDLEMLIKLKECHEYDVAVTQLRKLEILELPELKHVWNEDPHGILSFENLSSVDVRFCPSLKSLFSASVARNLIWLETLFIGNCGLEENIVAEEKEFESNPKFVLPRLKQLTLRSLPQLQSFYNGIHALECPELQALRIHGCDKVEIFSSTPQDREETCLETQSKIQFQHPFLSLTKAVNLEELTINGSDISKLQHGQFPVPHLYKLKVVHLHFLKDDWTELPFDFLVKFQNLDTLMMRDCDFKELFPCDMVGEVVSTLSRIRHLKLSFLPYIRHVWNQESQPHQFLQNLQTLQISICDSLISLAPSSASFQNLSVVDVYLCEGMLNLISSSTALSLVNLTSMSIKECEEVTEIIVANEGDEFQFQSGDIIFRKLATLKLDCLKSLICFCSATCTIKFPSLEEVYVSQCPRLKIFSNGVLSVPKLKRVYVTEEGDKWRWIGDLNTTIKQMYIEMVGFNAIQHLKLSEFPQLKEVWHDQLPFNFFYNLSTLVIDECGSFPISVPSSLLPVLNNLEELEVRNCNSVEQAFGLEWPNGNEHLGFLSNLNSLRLIDLPRLRCVWHEIPKGTLDLRNLKMLKFHGCSSLRYIFTPTLSLCLVQLKEVVVESCVMVEEIITKGVAKQVADNIIFPVLDSISLESLPSLISFNSGNKTAECPSLKQITVADCPSKFCSTFLRELGANVADGISELKVLFPSLKEVKLLLLDIEKIWHTPQLEMSSVQNLTSLIVDGCGNLKYLSSSTMIKSIVHLKRLEICDCKMLEEVIVLEELEENVMNIKLFLHDLDFLKLQDLPKLTEFCTCNLIECPALKELWIQNCPQLTTFALKFSSANIAATSGLEILNSTLFDEKVMFPNLEEMQMRNMDNLKTIWHKELRSNSFCRIKVLKVEDVKQSAKIFPSSILRSLEELVIKNCESVEEVFDLQELMNMKETVVSQLRLLVIDNLPNLKHVWNEDPLGFVSFHHLSSVYVWNCLNLKILFPTSVAKGLSQLEALNIDGCGLEEIVAKEEEDAKATPKFVFPRLKSLYLWGLQQLRCFYPGTHTLECPVLEKLQVYRCPRLEIFTFEPNNLPELHLESQLEKVVINLEHLSLPTKDAIMMSQLPVPGNLFHKLKSVNINCFNDEFAVFPVDLLLKFQNIEKLVVCCCDFKELLPYEGLVDKNKHVNTLAKIQHLELDLLPHVKHIWNQHTQLNQGLPYLESLLVKRCDSLISLAPSPASFKNLTTLDVMKCNGLVSLVTPSTAKSLGQLKKMSIQECNMVKKIIAGEGDESKEEIIFRRLESLQLSSLPNLVSFCWEEHTFRFPCLTQVIMRQCPKMQVFSNGALSTPVIRRVQVTEEESEKGRWNINLNSTIQHMFAEMGN